MTAIGNVIAGADRCVTASQGAIALLIIACGVIGLSYSAFPVGLVWFARRRGDLLREHRRLLFLLGAFMGASSAASLSEILTYLYPVYWPYAAVKIATAILAVSVIAVLWPRLPRLAGLPSARDLTEINQRLRREVAAHEASLRELEAARRELESPVEQRTRELAEVKAKFEAAIRGSNVTLFTQDSDLRYTSISNSFLGREVAEIVGRTDDEILPPDSRGAIVALKRAALDRGTPHDGEVVIHTATGARWYDLHIEPIRSETGAVVGLTCAAVDITERKESEAHLRMLMRELTHRSKNLLAVIQAIARQTARHSGTVDAFIDQFSARLLALARSHDLLVQEGWHGVSLEELVRSQLGHHLDRSGSQIKVAGPRVLLRPEAAQSLGLALHELATNAAKYGALSVPTGEVSITWKWKSSVPRSGIEMNWVEGGGPPVKGRDRVGFGSMIIERNLSRSLGAEVQLNFTPGGLQCRIEIPDSQLSIG
jgi:PAS domain S-box-containing protein